MSITIGQIVKNLIPTEPVTITQMQDLGKMISVSYTGVNTNISSNKVLTRAAVEKALRAAEKKPQAAPVK